MVRFWFEVCWSKIPIFIKIGPFFGPVLAVNRKPEVHLSQIFDIFFHSLKYENGLSLKKIRDYNHGVDLNYVDWNLGCGATPIWAGRDQKYFSYLINSQKGLMGLSFGKIPEIEVPPVLMTWKICLLSQIQISFYLK